MPLLLPFTIFRNEKGHRDTCSVTFLYDKPSKRAEKMRISAILLSDLVQNVIEKLSLLPFEALEL